MNEQQLCPGGRKDDGGKNRLDLIPPQVILALGQVMTYGAGKYGANNWQIFTQLCIPSALPMVFGALQLALAYCWTNLVAAELLAADSGLGFLITMGGRLGRPDIIVLGMICVGLSGAVIGFIIDQVEKKLLAGIRR